MMVTYQQARIYHSGISKSAPSSNHAFQTSLATPTTPILASPLLPSAPRRLPVGSLSASPLLPDDLVTCLVKRPQLPGAGLTRHWTTSLLIHEYMGFSIRPCCHGTDSFDGRATVVQCTARMNLPCSASLRVRITLIHLIRFPLEMPNPFPPPVVKA
jgi:hypothetical protein